jgi:hypothetical protein
VAGFKQELPVGTIHRIWRWTRAYVFTEEVYASPLAGTPYDLRHAAVSTWLNRGSDINPGRRVGRPVDRDPVPDLREVSRRRVGNHATGGRRCARLGHWQPGEPGDRARVMAVNLAAYLP